MWTSRGQVVCPLGRLDHGTSTEVVGPIFRIRTCKDQPGKKEKKPRFVHKLLFFLFTMSATLAGLLAGIHLLVIT